MLQKVVKAMLTANQNIPFKAERFQLRFTGETHANYGTRVHLNMNASYKTSNDLKTYLTI